MAWKESWPKDSASWRARPLLLVTAEIWMSYVINLSLNFLTCEMDPVRLREWVRN